jgi:hypothetical protein
MLCLAISGIPNICTWLGSLYQLKFEIIFLRLRMVAMAPTSGFGRRFLQICREGVFHMRTSVPHGFLPMERSSYDMFEVFREQ